ncbi:hypothetical protein GUITHDRAFT_111195 [Guillardia theta CCMP2712]|uniref:NADAR domain-containing protein n=2 Tax=Guillardia theta TaxID=55529 RepID=L1J421_GUITC|nr:hypothetical protein GUITHDRAFT_140966 [Guillardia theta CCMP2712]XP_005829805.1 hypothetical protein GUITHDRAFT_111195 [Guillardia theta CCMP2712]EKX42824.1 hypothetical protein GUITHDRAFT_140966 [Guillardia theta CCMP2712]EKX42825.1 hypothetical protein GUITHDRAFT_111195 [Guillardia theta CCMP2712]|eukprot:XP_005829804.1 hypothetical protein GUITHDRAFT_140966 [Guillardia theta CCMP2712]
MGGKCFLVEQDKSQVEGPACTDNFQVVKFMYDGLEWHSVEQCYQAAKYITDRRLYIRDMLPKDGESDEAYGLRMWDEGQCFTSQMNPQWLDVRMHVMYLINRAKYQHNPSLQEELLTTGDKLIWGKPSTHEWQKWNGLIQMRIREEIQSKALDGPALSQSELMVAFQPNLDRYISARLLEARE